MREPPDVSGAARAERAEILAKLTKPLLQVLAARVGFRHTTKTLKAGLISGILCAEGYGEPAEGAGLQISAGLGPRDPHSMTRAVLRQQCHAAGATHTAKLRRSQLIEMWRRTCEESDDEEEYPSADLEMPGGGAAIQPRQNDSINRDRATSPIDPRGSGCARAVKASNDCQTSSTIPWSPSFVPQGLPTDMPIARECPGPVPGTDTLSESAAAPSMPSEDALNSEDADTIRGRKRKGRVDGPMPFTGQLSAGTAAPAMPPGERPASDGLAQCAGASEEIMWTEPAPPTPHCALSWGLERKTRGFTRLDESACRRGDTAAARTTWARR